jgi:hypothetical protein
MQVNVGPCESAPPDYGTLLLEYQTILQANQDLQTKLRDAHSAITNLPYSVPSHSPDALLSELQQRDDEIAALRSEIRSRDADLDTLRAENAALRTDLSAAARAQASLAADLSLAHTENDRLTVFERKSSRLRAKLAALRARAGESAAAPLVDAEAQVEAHIDPQWLLGNLRHEMSKLRRQLQESELQILGHEKTHKLAITHIRGLEEENARLKHATVAPQQGLLRDLTLLQQENAILHERLLASSRQLGELLGRVEELKAKIHAAQAVESDECRGDVLKGFMQGMDLVRRKVLRDHGIAEHPLEGENAELRERVAELEEQARDAARREDMALREIARLHARQTSPSRAVAEPP